MSTKSIVNPSSSMSVEHSHSTTFYALRPANLDDVFDYINTLTPEAVINNIANEPSTFITSVRIYPFSFTATDNGHVVSDNNIKLGRYDCQLDAGGAGGASVECFRLTDGYKTHFNLGTYTFTPHFNNFLDYSPYTKYELYLPYCGFVDMDATEYTGKTISIDYILDYTQGSCLAVVSDITNANDHVVLFSKGGTVGVPITWQATNSGQVIRGAISSLANVGGMMLGGAAAKARGMKQFRNAQDDYFFEHTLQMGRFAVNGVKSDSLAFEDKMAEWHSEHPAPNKADYLQNVNPYLSSNIITTGVNGMSNAVLNTPLSVTRGEIGGDFSIFSMPQKPYIITTRTHTALPTNYTTLMGKPSGKTATLSQLSGFTSIDAIRVEGIKSVNGVSPTSVELATIDEALRNGVII